MAHLHCESSVSLVNIVSRPFKNAFSESERLGDYIDFFTLLVVDLMHEFELGVWKAVLTHLIRILSSLKKHELQIFDERYVKPMNEYF